MAKPAKRRVAGGRVTPKKSSSTASSRPEASSRYTPPVPREYKHSPTWVPVLMFTLLGLGVLVIFLNYLGVFPEFWIFPDGTSNAYLGIGLGSICGGILVATQYR
ncbi:MAG: cell division protein CrgA [Acidimicrobiales bacterium]